MVAAYLADIPEGVPKQNGIDLGEAVAAKMLGQRADDGAQAPHLPSAHVSRGLCGDHAHGGAAMAGHEALCLEECGPGAPGDAL